MSNLISRLSIRGRFTLIAVTLLFLLIASSLTAIVSMYSIGKELKSITEEDIPLVEILTKITVHQLEQAVHFERALRFAQNQGASAHLADSMASEKKKFYQLSERVDKEAAEALQLTKAILAVPHSPEHEREFQFVADSLKEVSQLHKTYEEHASKVFQLLKNERVAEAEKLSETIVEEEQQLDRQLSELVVSIEQFTEQAARTATDHEVTAERNQIILFLVSALVSITLCWQVSKITQTHLNRVGAKLSAIAGGDLTQTVDGDDEVNAPLREMQKQLVDLIHTIQSAAEKLSETVSDVSASSYQTEKNIVEQQTQTELVASAATEMHATSKEVSNHVRDTAEAADHANGEAVNGRQVLESAIAQVLELAEQIQGASTVIGQLEQDTDSISSVLQVISEIAEQTNLLALNAAIEAARAGEQGRGFAVVADEVRTLAGRTQESTESIRTMIETLQKGSKRAVDVMSISREKSDSVVSQVRNAETSLVSIAESIDRINTMSEQISTASSEQISVTNEIDRNVTQISSMGAENTSSTHLITESMRGASGMSEELLGLVKKFKV